MEGFLFYGSVMLDLREDMLVEKLQLKIYYMLDYGGQPYSKIPNNMWDHVIYVKE